MTFRIGQKVVCVGLKGKPGIDWASWLSYWKVALPKRGSVYVVRDTRDGGERQLIRLVEIINPIVEWIDSPPTEPWFWSIGFRPLIERSTDTGMAMLKEILERSREPEDA